MRLAFERAVIVTSWAMEGLTEGIDVSLDHDALPNATNVQGTPRWRPFVGQTLQEAAASWHVPNEGCPVTLWAIRLTFTHASSVSIALGEIEDGDVQYQPDALLVLFGESAARAYRPPAALDNALGSPLG